MESDVRPIETSQSAAGEYRVYPANCIPYLEDYIVVIYVKTGNISLLDCYSSFRVRASP